jgi:hypothetical protein
MMPVYKYRRIEDMPEPWEHFGDRNIGGRLRFVLSTARLAGPLNVPRGVFKFHTMDDLSADRERYENQRIEHLRKQRQPK